MEDREKRAIGSFLNAFIVGLNGFGSGPNFMPTVLDERIRSDGHELGYLARLWRRGILTETQMVMAAQDIESRWPHRP